MSLSHQLRRAVSELVGAGAHFPERSHLGIEMTGQAQPTMSTVIGPGNRFESDTTASAVRSRRRSLTRRLDGLTA
jgi:hypothetical protein